MTGAGIVTTLTGWTAQESGLDFLHGKIFFCSAQGPHWFWGPYVKILFETQSKLD
jgi:hypothetical protein